MDTSLEWKIVLGQRRLTQVTDFMRSRNMEEDMVEYRYLWLLGMDRLFLAL